MQIFIRKSRKLGNKIWSTNFLYICMLPLKALVSTMEDTKKEGASNIRNPLNGDPRLKAMHFNL